MAPVLRPGFHPFPLRRHWRGAAVLAVGWLLAVPAWAATRSYTLDPVHTRVAFQVSHAGFSNPLGSFSGVSGTLEFDDKDWASAHVEVRIPVASLNLGDAPWQQKILDRSFFDAGKFPDAHFVSTRVEASGEHAATVTGELTLHGITAPLTLQVTLNALKRHPLTLKKTAGFSATGTLSRKAFGIDAWKNLVGDEVRLIIEAEATRSHEDAATPATAPVDSAAPTPAPIDSAAPAEAAEPPVPSEPRHAAQ